MSAASEQNPIRGEGVSEIERRSKTDSPFLSTVITSWPDDCMT